MSKSSSVAVQRKVTATLPEELLAPMEARIPSRQRSATAIETQLAIVEQADKEMNGFLSGNLSAYFSIRCSLKGVAKTL